MDDTRRHKKKFVDIDLSVNCLPGYDLLLERADMFPKMTWGTPPPPQTPFTYPPYKRIGHMAVMGASMAIESRKDQLYLSTEYEETFARGKVCSLISIIINMFVASKSFIRWIKPVEICF